MKCLRNGVRLLTTAVGAARLGGELPALVVVGLGLWATATIPGADCPADGRRRAAPLAVAILDLAPVPTSPSTTGVLRVSPRGCALQR